jgi:5,6-dimethylbenzimidazole synthase
LKHHISHEAGDFSGEEREAVYCAIFARRDVRKDFLPDPIPEKTLRRILLAAHHAGSVGYMQPWNFLIIRQTETKQVVKNLFVQANRAAALSYHERKPVCIEG